MSKLMIFKQNIFLFLLTDGNKYEAIICFDGVIVKLLKFMTLYGNLFKSTSI